MKQNILVVEDNIIIAQDIIEILEELGFKSVYKSHQKLNAFKLLESIKFDLVLIDINLQKSLDGIELAKWMDEKCPTPYLYLTSYSDDLIISKIKETKPKGIVLKPFSKETLKVNLLLAIKENENTSIIGTKEKKLDHNLLTIKDGYEFVKIKIDEILWIEADKNYIHVKFENKKLTLRDSLKHFKTKLPDYFEFSHKRYIVNVKEVNRYNSSEVLIKNQILPIGRNFQNTIYKKLTSFS